MAGNRDPTLDSKVIRFPVHGESTLRLVLLLQQTVPAGRRLTAVQIPPLANPIYLPSLVCGFVGKITTLKTFNNYRQHVDPISFYTLPFVMTKIKFDTYIT